MRFAIVLVLVVFATSASAQSAADMISQHIGQLTIQNANLAEQLNKANAKIKDIEAKLPKETPPEPNK